MEIKVGLIGAGFMGRSHALAINAANSVQSAVPHMLVELNSENVQQRAIQFGFAKFSDDWKDAIDSCDAIVIAVPSYLHKKITLAAIRAGKHVLCEKPVGLSGDDAREIAASAEVGRASHMVGFTYLRSPLIR